MPTANLEVPKQRQDLAGVVVALENRRALGVAHAANNGVALLHIEGPPLHREEHYFGVKPIHHRREAGPKTRRC